MQSAAREGRIRDFMEGVTEDFSGNQGLDRAALHNLLRAQALGKTTIGVSSSPLQVDLHGSKATVTFNVLLTGGSGGLLPDSAQGYAITSGWTLEEGEWRVYYADWESKL